MDFSDESNEKQSPITTTPLENMTEEEKMTKLKALDKKKVYKSLQNIFKISIFYIS